MLTTVQGTGRGESVEERYGRLAEIARGGATDAQRILIREILGPALERYRDAVELAAGAIEGPDPEMAILYILDAAIALRAESIRLDAAIT